MYLAGGFSKLNTTARDRAAAVNTVLGQASTTWKPNPDSQVRSLLVSGSKVFLGGVFNNVGGTRVRSVTAVDTKNGVPIPTWMAG